MRPTALIALGGLLIAAPLLAQSAPSTSTPVEDLYKTNCAMCHMPDGNAAIKEMNFADGEWKHGTSVKQMTAVITNGVPGTAMMPFKGRLSEQEILALAKYVRKFDKKLKADGPAKGGAKPKSTAKPKSGDK